MRYKRHLIKLCFILKKRHLEECQVPNKCRILVSYDCFIKLVAGSEVKSQENTRNSGEVK